MPEQTALFTPVPNGVTEDGARLRVLVHVAPRLLTTGPLSDYPDWRDWPQALSAITDWKVRFLGLGDAFTRPLTVVGPDLADSAVWTRLFPPATKVNGHRFRGFTNRLLHSYPTNTITTFLQERWGRFGTESPDGFPSFDSLVDDDGFGPIAFEVAQRNREGDDNGPARKARLVAGNGAMLKPDENDPDFWAIAHGGLPADPVARRDEIGRRFLELEQFHVRGRRGVRHDPLVETVHEPDFHELVAMVQRYPRLLRKLGLVVALEFDVTSAHHSDTEQVQIEATWTPQLPNHAPVFARTMCAVHPTEFGAISQPGADSDLAASGRQLMLSDPNRFAVHTVDADAGAIKSMQFADNVARSRPDAANVAQRFSAYTPNLFALPTQSSAGLAVARPDRARRLAHSIANAAAVNASSFDKVTGAPLPPAFPGLDPPSPLFYADDLVRGYRWDVRSDSDPFWRSLMETEGTYEVGANGDTVTVEADGEAIAVSGASTAGGAAPPPDLYVAEALMRWTGWSLAARQPGATVGRDDNVADPDAGTDPDGNPAVPPAPIRTDVRVKPGSLPRLRFGETYRVRGRSVDIAGASDAVYSAAEQGAESPAVDYLRYEPVSAPLALLRDPAEVPGESNFVVVVRSENAQDAQPGENHRHLVPPRTTIVMAEHHGLLDTDQLGEPLDLQALANLGALDAQDLADHPAIQPPASDVPLEARWFPVDSLALNYLPDPLAKRLLVRDLPTVAGLSEHYLPVANGGWPNYSSGQLALVKGASASWSAGAGNDGVVVTLGKGDDIFVRVSAAFGPTDREDLMGLWRWIQEWHANHGGDLADAQAKIDAGKHVMFSPWKQLRLVHAVRTPLLAPELPPTFTAGKPNAVGATFADLRWTGAFSRKSTGKIDVLADWSMKVDSGPRTNADPTTPQAFKAVATEIANDHRAPGPDSGTFVDKHDFGDTKYRSVAYHLVATSAFTEFFREEKEVVVPGPAAPGEAPPPIPVDARGLVAATVAVKRLGSTGDYRQGPAADYVVDEAAGTLVRKSHQIATGDTLVVRYVVPSIHQTSATQVRQIKSSARPAAPKVEYVLPTFEWNPPNPTGATTSARTGNSLRVYLKRPWWTSGDDEKLAVVLWRPPVGHVDPAPDLAPYVTMWGLDPLFAAPGPSNFPTLASFPAAVDVPLAGVALADRPGVVVDIAPHEVHFDAERDLWYSDIPLNFGAQANAYWPFVRLAVARYQPHSLPGLELSPAVLADFAQVAPHRTVSVSQTNGTTWHVQIQGRGYTTNTGDAGAARMQVTVEKTRNGVTDPNLKWQQRGTSTLLSHSIQGGNFITWQGNVTVPADGGPYRLVVEEVEVHRTGSESIFATTGGGRRVVFTDIINL